MGVESERTVRGPAQQHGGTLTGGLEKMHPGQKEIVCLA